MLKEMIKFYKKSGDSREETLKTFYKNKNSRRILVLDFLKKSKRISGDYYRLETLRLVLRMITEKSEADFQHFLSYSGYWQENDEIKEKLRRAFFAAWEPSSLDSLISNLLS